MKYFVSIFLLASLVSFRVFSDIYSIPLKSIDGKKVDLSEFKGMKMLFIVLPLSANDTTVSLKQIQGLQGRYRNSLAVIGIPAEEAGFERGNEDQLKQLYRTADRTFLILEGMKVKKGPEQQTLFRWLTSREYNQHFDQDVRGVGSKFFVDEFGELYAVMGPEFKLTNPLMDKILTRRNGKQP
ncbi:thioredoxin domain-containing protein [Pseudocnuella soli]|uniref:hypothetical protein n=1 Tax=Pseudocnuella soli TaxID=2502779 RepID=UPI0010500179|nr:hypothetical protein [Pseudocnuella soli]